MDSSVIVNRQPSGMVDSMDVNGCQTPNALPTGINVGGLTTDGGSACSLLVGDDSDDSFSGSIEVSNPKRKYGSESGNGDSNEEDDSVPIAKSRKLDIPILVEPIRSVKSSELEDSVSPDSVKVENLSALEALPLSMCPMERSEDNNEVSPPIKSCRQFWKAGDYEGNCDHDPILSSGK